MSTVRIATTARNAAADAIADLADAGASNGYIEIRTGAMPANPQTAASGTLLATCTFGDPAFGASAVGVVTANAIAGDASPPATGTPGWARVYDSDDAPVLDMDCGTSGATLTIPTDITAGVPFSITAGQFTMPEEWVG